MAINFGKKIVDGPIDEVLQHEEVIHAYLGEAIH
jgi:ABC-type branched-subunit amino acid transport system ATPase component